MTDVFAKNLSDARKAFAAERARWEPLIVTVDTAVEGLGKAATFSAKAIDGAHVQVTYTGVSERMHELSCVSVLTTEPVRRGDLDDGSLRFISHGWKGEPDFTKTGIDTLSEADPQTYEVGPSENNRIVGAIIEAATRYINEQPGSLAAAGCLSSARRIYTAEIDLGRHMAEVAKAEAFLASCRFSFEMYLEKAKEVHPELGEPEASGPGM